MSHAAIYVVGLLCEERPFQILWSIHFLPTTLLLLLLGSGLLLLLDCCAAACTSYDTIIYDFSRRWMAVWDGACDDNGVDDVI